LGGEKYAIVVNLVRADCNRGVMDGDEPIARLAGGDDAAPCGAASMGGSAR
jgi:hypothetical protein